MSTQSLILPPIDVLARSAAELASRAAGDKPRVNAINKAAMHLHHGLTPISTYGGFLLASGTRDNLVHRVSTVNGCSCEAGRKGSACWHVALIEIIEEAQRYSMPAFTAPLQGDRITRALAEMDELYPHR